jgi:hypothetical protein
MYHGNSVHNTHLLLTVASRSEFMDMKCSVWVSLEQRAASLSKW